MTRATIETHAANNPRILVFYGVVAAIVVVLLGGMAYRQLLKTGLYTERERIQNQRRVIVPGPRGNIYDRNGKLLVGNRARFSVVLNLAELRSELRSEYSRVRKNFLTLPKDERPNAAQLTTITRTAVVQRYLDQVNAILGRHEKVDARRLANHFDGSLLLPFQLLTDLAPQEYARLIERLPVESPLQVYASSVRYYPFGSAASHALGYIGADTDPDAEEFPGDDLLTFKMKGSYGSTGLEKQFDSTLQGKAGGAIYRVDPAGYKAVGLPIEKRPPVQGADLHTSLDIELQIAAETAMEGKTGAILALDVATGEVLVMASKPDLDPLTRIPNLASDADVEKSGVWVNRAIRAEYPPGSTFKIVTAIAGLRSGAIDRDDTKTVCTGTFQVGARTFVCHLHSGHGERDVAGAVRDSCNVFFYKTGLDMGPELISAEAIRFGFNSPTGIELPGEYATPHVASPAWKRENMKERWYPGDTANMAIGQGDTLITPLHAACMIASFARGETITKPTLLHDPRRPRQHSESIGLNRSDYDTIVRGMAMGYQFGTGKLARVEGLTAGTKSGTAQKKPIEIAWMVCFAPLENPKIAIAVALEGKPGENFGGSINAGPVVQAILEKWREKQEREPTATFQVGAP